MFANPNQSMTFIMTCDDKESVISKHDSFKNSSLLSRRKSNQSNLQTVLGVSCECSIGYRPGMFRLTTNGMDKQRSCQAKPCQIMSNHAKSCQIMPNHAKSCTSCSSSYFSMHLLKLNKEPTDQGEAGAQEVEEAS